MPQVEIQGGERVRIQGLVKGADNNGYIGTIREMNPDNGRAVTEVFINGEKKLLALQPKNVQMVRVSRATLYRRLRINLPPA